MRNSSLFALACFALVVLLSSCGSRWYCYVDSVGSNPSDKTYYPIQYFPSDVNPLVASQLMADFDVVMAKAGYTKADSVNASLKVYFAYRLGEMHEKIKQTTEPVFRTTLPTTSYGYVTTPVYTEGGVVLATSVAEVTTPGMSTYAGQETTISSETVQDFEMRIDAYTNDKAEKPVFTVSIIDAPSAYVTHDLRRYMPLYLLSAMQYIGKPTTARTPDPVNEHDSRLKWFTAANAQSGK